MADAAPGIAELCDAIRAGDEQAAAVRRREFAAHNWPMVNAIDQMAHAAFAAGNYVDAAKKLELLEELLPDVTGVFLRRVSAAIRAGLPAAVDEFTEAAPRLANDGELFHVVEELVANGRLNEASAVIDTCKARPAFSAGIIAACRSRVLANAGRTGEGIGVLAEEMATQKPNLTAMRCQYLLLEHMLDFDAAWQLCWRAAFLWGEERELRHLVERLSYVFRFDTIDPLLEQFGQHHPARAGLARDLAANVAAARTAATSAVAEHGPVHGLESAEIFKALSEAGTPPSRVLWGKQALMALLRDGRMTEADYTTFAWFLPNWEQAPVRHHVLAAAKKFCPGALSVERGWLHHLITAGSYGDAAHHCLYMLDGAVDEDILFFVIMLLRLQQDGTVPQFMLPEVANMLRDRLLPLIDSTDAGFRCVMHDHFVALGWPEKPWPDDAVPPHDAHDLRGFRRLFATTTGRLSRVGTGKPARKPPKIRPVLAISGQLRGFETAWPSIYKRLARPTGAPLVMSVWDKTVNAKGRHARRLERVLPQDIIDQLAPEERYTDTFEAAYPKTAALLFGQTDVDAAALRRLVDQTGIEVLELETESEDVLGRLLHPHISPNMLKMYYKFGRLEALIREAEWRSGEVFSHVLWARPDCEIVRLSDEDVASCLNRIDIVWSSFVTETSFGDYAMILPRSAFADLGSIFGRTGIAGDTWLLPWRPNRNVGKDPRTNLDAFGGPDVIFDCLLASGYMPVSRIPRMSVQLTGRVSGPKSIRKAFNEETTGPY